MGHGLVHPSELALTGLGTSLIRRTVRPTPWSGSESPGTVEAALTLPVAFATSVR